jgi:starvation-inducible DNA-binding protein
MPISCPLPVSTSAHGIASRPRWLGVIEAYWRAINSTEELDLVTQDMLIGQSGQLEEFHWFVRAHLEAPDGSLTTGNASTEKTAAKRAKKRLPGAPRHSVVVLTTTM